MGGWCEWEGFAPSSCAERPHHATRAHTPLHLLPFTALQSTPPPLTPSPTSQLRYLGESAAMAVEGIDDVTDWKRTRDAMGVFQVGEKEIGAVSKVRWVHV